MGVRQLTEASINKSDRRILELDFLRGVALILMVYFHTIYDLNEFYDYPVNYSYGVNYYIGKVSAILFMLISGFSASLSRSNIKRGLKVLGIAMIITVITHLYDLEYGIKFGILHFLGVSMLLAPLFIKLHQLILMILGTGILLFGNLVAGIDTSVRYLFPFGITDQTFASSDYYPLFPWFGVFLIGLSMGKLLYCRKKRLLSFYSNENLITVLGRNTLPVYLLHQPSIMIVLWFLQYLGVST